MFILDEPSPQEMDVMNSARSDEKMVKSREQVMQLIQRSLEVWLKDALVYDVCLLLLLPDRAGSQRAFRRLVNYCELSLHYRATRHC